MQSSGHKFFSNSGFPKQKYWNVNLRDAVNLVAELFHYGTARESKLFRGRDGWPDIVGSLQRLLERDDAGGSAHYLFSFSSNI